MAIRAAGEQRPRRAAQRPNLRLRPKRGRAKENSPLQILTAAKLRPQSRQFFSDKTICVFILAELRG